MAGVPISASGLADFFNSTGSAVIDDPNTFVNDAQKNSPTLAVWMAGKSQDDMFGGGKNFTGAIMLDESSTAINQLPGASLTYSNPQVLDYFTYKWTITTDFDQLLEAEIILNSPEQMSGQGRFQQLKAVDRKSRTRSMTSMYNFMSGKFWSEPDFTTMEGTGSTAIEQNSIPCFLNEYANGLYNSAGSAGTAWTTVGGINPTSSGNSRWMHRTSAYTSNATGQPKGSGSTAGATVAGVVEAFDDMFLKIKYRQYNRFDEYMTQSPLDKVFIATSKRGYTHYQQICRDRQDRFIQAADPNFPGLNYAGIPVQYHEELDAATLYPNHQTLASATDNVAEGNLGSANANMGLGPRYYWLHPKFIKPVFHKSRFFYQREAIVPPDQPDAVIRVFCTYWNIIATSRRRLGLVSPTGNAFVAYSN